MLKFINGIENWRKPPDGRKLSVIVTGDCYPGHVVAASEASGEPEKILAGVREFLDSADLRFVQWETPLTNDDTPIAKSGPNLKAPPECVKLALAGNFDAALLANNHVGDFGPVPVLQTINTFHRRGIKTVGAGKDSNAAAAPLFLEKNGFKIGVMNIAESEFGTAAGNKPGSAPLEVPDTIRQIEATTQNVDLMLVVMHGGNEHNPVPTPRMMKTCRAFAAAGAAAVINIHPHCPQGIEIRNGAPIIYCPGNFFFPFDGNAGLMWYISYLPKISFDRDGAFQLEIEPIIFSAGPCRIRTLEPPAKKRFYSYLAELSQIISSPKQVAKYFDAWCAMRGEKIMNTIKNSMSVWNSDKPDDTELVKELLHLRNLFTCESHCELTGNYLRLLETGRFREAQKYIPEIRKLQNPVGMKDHDCGKR
ncbi:MAG: CapA family protein [Victivallales bacterium]|nr:CapA family protein [Victivallales bacterium]